MSAAVEVAEEREGSSPHDPFAGERIEVPESELRSVSRHEVLLGRVKQRLDGLATRLVYGR